MSIEINKKFVSLQMSFFFLVQARFLYECDGCGKAVGGCDGGGGGSLKWRSREDPFTIHRKLQ